MEKKINFFHFGLLVKGDEGNRRPRKYYRVDGAGKWRRFLFLGNKFLLLLMTETWRSSRPMTWWIYRHPVRPRARDQLTFKLRAVAADGARGKDNLRSRRYRISSGKFWPSPLLSLSSCINIECIVVLNNASTHKIRETFIRLLKKGKLPHRVNGPLRAPIICLNYAIEPKRLALYINTMLLLLFLLLFLWLSSLLLLHWNNVIPYIFVGRLTDHTHNLKLE